MLVKTLVDAQSVTADTQSASVTLHMPKTIRGIVQYRTTSFSGLTNIVFKLQGRLSEDMEWIDVSSSTKTHTSSTTTGVEDITLYPLMRCDMDVTGTGSVTVDVQIGS